MIRDGINSCEFVNIVIYPRCFLDNVVNTHAINIDDIANKLQIKLKISLAYSSTINLFHGLFQGSSSRDNLNEFSGNNTLPSSVVVNCKLVDDFA